MHIIFDLTLLSGFYLLGDHVYLNHSYTNHAHTAHVWLLMKLKLLAMKTSIFKGGGGEGIRHMSLLLVTPPHISCL
jgi:hypothetical protein